MSRSSDGTIPVLQNKNTTAPYPRNVSAENSNTPTSNRVPYPPVYISPYPIPESSYVKNEGEIPVLRKFGPPIKYSKALFSPLKQHADVVDLERSASLLVRDDSKDSKISHSASSSLGASPSDQSNQCAIKILSGGPSGSLALPSTLVHPSPTKQLKPSLIVSRLYNSPSFLVVPHKRTPLPDARPKPYQSPYGPPNRMLPPEGQYSHSHKSFTHPSSLVNQPNAFPQPAAIVQSLRRAKRKVSAPDLIRGLFKKKPITEESTK